MFSRTLVNVRIAPGVIRDALEVRSVPAGCIARLLEQVHQPVLALRITSSVHLEGIQRSFEVGDLGHRRLFLGLLRAPGKFGYNDGRQNAKDDQDQQQFDEGEGVVTGRRGVGFSRVLDFRVHGCG